MTEILKEETPSNEYSFDALELVDAINSVNQSNNDEPFPAVWVRQKNGLIDGIAKVTLEKDSDGDTVVYLILV